MTQLASSLLTAMSRGSPKEKEVTPAAAFLLAEDQRHNSARI
jgi:hypothetical protein